MYAKIHQQGNKSVLAVCDKDLLGKSLKSGKIKFKVSESFYGGRKVKEKKLRKLLEENNNINLIGEKCVKIALEEKLINENSIIKIENVPHAQIFKIKL